MKTCTDQKVDTRILCRTRDEADKLVALLGAISEGFGHDVLGVEFDEPHDDVLELHNGEENLCTVIQTNTIVDVEFTPEFASVYHQWLARKAELRK